MAGLIGMQTTSCPGCCFGAFHLGNAAMLRSMVWRSSRTGRHGAGFVALTIVVAQAVISSHQSSYANRGEGRLLAGLLISFIALPFAG